MQKELRHAAGAGRWVCANVLGAPRDKHQCPGGVMQAPRRQTCSLLPVLRSAPSHSRAPGQLDAISLVHCTLVSGFHLCIAPATVQAMVRPKSKAKPQSGSRKRQRDDFFEEPDEQDEFFVQSGDEEGGAGSDSGEEDEEQDETAEEKRLRLGGGQPEWMQAANRGMHAAAGTMCRRRRLLPPPLPAATCRSKPLTKASAPTLPRLCSQAILGAGQGDRGGGAGAGLRRR